MLSPEDSLFSDISSFLTTSREEAEREARIDAEKEHIKHFAGVILAKLGATEALNTVKRNLADNPQLNVWELAFSEAKHIHEIPDTRQAAKLIQAAILGEPLKTEANGTIIAAEFSLAKRTNTEYSDDYNGNRYPRIKRPSVDIPSNNKLFMEIAKNTGFVPADGKFTRFGDKKFHPTETRLLHPNGSGYLLESSTANQPQDNPDKGTINIKISLPMTSPLSKFII